MRNKLLSSGASMVLTMAIAGAIAAGVVEDRYDQLHTNYCEVVLVSGIP